MKKKKRNFQPNIPILKLEILKQLNDINLEKCVCYIDNNFGAKKQYYTKLNFISIFFFFPLPLSQYQ